jgi:predicted DNA repair protein MutK
VIEWLANAIGASIVGLVVGGVIVLIVRQFTTHPEKLVVDL